MAKAETKKKTLRVTQLGSPIGRKHDQRETLIGLGLNKRHRRPCQWRDAYFLNRRRVCRTQSRW